MNSLYMTASENAMEKILTHMIAVEMLKEDLERDEDKGDEGVEEEAEFKIR